MRRKLAIVATLALGAGLTGTAPAQAQAVPLTIIVTEGIGNVCANAKLSPAEVLLYGQKPSAAGAKVARCNYPGAGYDAPVNPGQSSHPQWWKAHNYPNATSWLPNENGLFAPGVGPGAIGPYELTISASVPNPPQNVCVDSIEGPGCSTRIAGLLTKGPQSGFGAHAGSSTGSGSFAFSSANGQYKSTGTLGWEQSAATILPLEGTATYTITGQSGTKSSTLIGFTSSRGAGGSTGNAGATAATIGFQVEGMIIAY